MSSSGFHCFFTVITGFYWVLLGFSGFYCFFLGCIGFYWVFTGFLLGFYWVLLGFTLISSLIVVSIGLHLGLPERERISMRTQISQTVFRTSLQPRWWRSLLKSWSDYFRWWSSFSFRITLRLFACSEDDPNSTNRKFRRRNIKKQRQNRVRFFVRLHFLIRPLSLSFPSPVFFYIFRFFLVFFFGPPLSVYRVSTSPLQWEPFCGSLVLNITTCRVAFFFYYSFWFSLDFLVKTKTKRSLWRVFLHLIGLTYRLGLGLANFFSYLMN